MQGDKVFTEMLAEVTLLYCPSMRENELGYLLIVKEKLKDTSRLIYSISKPTRLACHTYFLP